jgi:hypothetical protein
MDSNTCQPLSKLKLQNYKFYSGVVPTLIMFLVLEVVFVFMSVPSSSVQDVFTKVGPFPTSKVPLAK